MLKYVNSDPFAKLIFFYVSKDWTHKQTVCVFYIYVYYIMSRRCRPMKIFLKPAADLYYDAILKLNAHVLMIEALKAGSVGGIFFILRSLTLAKKRKPFFFALKIQRLVWETLIHH